jgi:hypothetical protein
MPSTLKMTRFSCYFCCYFCRRHGPAGLEDGTLPFTSIAAARHGFTQLMQLSSSSSSRDGFAIQQQQQQPALLLRDCFSRIDSHTACITWYLMQQLPTLRHSNGQRAAVLYCAPAVQQLLLQQQQEQADSAAAAAAAQLVDAGVLAAFRQLQGPVVAFNLLRADGSWVGHREVAKLALIHGICLRTGTVLFSCSAAAVVCGVCSVVWHVLLVGGSQRGGLAGIVTWHLLTHRHGAVCAFYGREHGVML